MATEIKLPDNIGEGVKSGDVLEVLVKVGDTISKDQGIVELETDKATVTVPASVGGKVIQVHVQQGQTVPVGGVLITVEASAGAKAAPAATPVAPKAEAPKPAPPAAPVVPEVKAPTPVVATAPPAAPVVEKPVVVAPPMNPVPVVHVAPAPVEAVPSVPVDVAAGPSIRRFAREVGVDLNRVVGTGLGGRITREDVLNVVRQANNRGSVAVAPQSGATAATTATATPAAATGTGEADKWGPVRIEKMTKMRKTIAAKMHESWTTVPRVTNFDDADVTDLEEFRQASKDDYAAQGIKLTSMPFLIKSVAMALKSNPVINASIDMEQGTIIYKDYVNIGIAVDTERGLVVPSLRAADRMSIPEISRQLAKIAENARTNSFSVDDLRGSSFTISNLGAIGGTYSTPIINTPETAILLVGRSRKLPVVVGDEIKIRLMMPLSLSYDHRLIDGAAGARFLNTIIGYLKAPSRLLLAP